MRGRWLKPEFFTDKKIAELGPTGALVYQALWVMADDTEGVAMCDPDLLKGQVFFRWSAVGVPEITEALRHLFSLGRIQFYQGGDELFAEVVHWKDNQPVHKPSKFTYRDDYTKRGKDLQETVPEWCGTSKALVRESPPPQHLDTSTPQHPNTYKKIGADAPEFDPYNHLMGVCREVGLTDMKTNGSVLKALLKKYKCGELEAVIRGLRLVDDSYRSLVPLNSQQHGSNIWAEAAQRYYQSEKPKPRKRTDDQMPTALDFSQYEEVA